MKFWLENQITRIVSFVFNILLLIRGCFTAILRLGCIWRERGNSAQALENYRKVIALDEENHIPHLFIANLHMAQGETRSAQTNYEKVLKLNNHKDDVYALTGLGNVWLEALYNVKRGEKDEKVPNILIFNFEMNLLLGKN